MLALFKMFIKYALNLRLQEFAETLMPLLLSMAAEAVPPNEELCKL